VEATLKLHIVTLIQKQISLGQQAQLKFAKTVLVFLKELKMQKKKLTVWEIWAKTIGSKIGPNDKDADIAALLRSVWVIVHMITCLMIILNNSHQLGWW
jgi:hypothetical protein